MITLNIETQDDITVHALNSGWSEVSVDVNDRDIDSILEQIDTDDIIGYLEGNDYKVTKEE